MCYPADMRPEPRQGKPPTTPGLSTEDLELLLAFTNAVSFGEGTGELGSSRAFRTWLAQRGLLAEEEQVADDELDRARQACTGFRALIAATGGSYDEDALERLDRLAMAAPIRARFLADGSTRLEPCSSGFTGVVERFVATVARARLNNLWPRLKICADDACRRVFYDESRNLCRRWCSQRCSSRQSTKSYRRRRKS
jgi:hypothetical protein